MQWYRYGSNVTYISKAFYQHKSNNVSFHLRENKAELMGFIPLQHFFSNQTPFIIQKICSLGYPIPCKPERSWPFRDVHLGQILCRYNTQTTLVSEIPVSPSPFPYIFGPQLCSMSARWGDGGCPGNTAGRGLRESCDVAEYSTTACHLPSDKIHQKGPLTYTICQA